MKTNLKDLTYSELNKLVTDLGVPAFHSKQIYQWLYRGINSFDEMTNVSKVLRSKLSEISYISTIEITEKLVSNIDETRKYLLKLEDGNYIESVLMKYKHGYTICVSSQVGCRMGCKFCASTVNGRIRNLSAGEIADQIMIVQKDLGHRISNIVMMGIGEPLDNFENVLKFIENVTDESGLNIGQRHISLSTCGLADKIRLLADKNLQITLSISLHATNDEMRSKIMPVNNRFHIEELLDSCHYYIKKTNRRISFEYTLIAGVNDNLSTAEDLGKLLSGMLCHINLIPVNSVTETAYKHSNRKHIEDFQHKLEKMGIAATIRREMGSDINAACGQLRNNRYKSERCVKNED